MFLLNWAALCVIQCVLLMYCWCALLEIVDYTLLRSIASFTPSMCFYRFHKRYFVLWKSSAARKIFAISFQKFELTSLMSSEKSDWPAVKSQIRSTYDKWVPIPVIEHQLDPNVNSVRFINKVISGQWPRASHSSRAFRLLPVSSLRLIHLESISTCLVSAIWEALSQW